MEQIEQLLALMDRPAFCAEGGCITVLNSAARSLALSEGMDLLKLLSEGREAYEEFTVGALTLALSLPGGSRAATVTVLENRHLFALEPESAEADFKMLALAAQALREPLSDVMALAESLPEDTDHRAELSRGLYRLLRIVGNMTPQPVFRPEMVELNALLREIWDQAQPACERLGIRFSLRPVRHRSSLPPMPPC